MKTLEVIAVEAGIDKRDNAFNKIKLSTPNFENQGGKRVRIEPLVQNVVKYPKSYLPDERPQFGHDAKVGEFIGGDIVTLGDLLPYPITAPDGSVTRMATSAKHVVLGNSDQTAAWKELIKREFRSRGKFSMYLADGVTKDPEAETAYFNYWGYAPQTIETGEVPAEEDFKEAGVTVEQTL